MAWQFQDGRFLSLRFQHWDEIHKLGLDILHHTDLTEFGDPIRPNLGHTLCRDGMWPFLRNILPEPGNFPMVDSFL
jgi:hypothetical protein